MRNAATHLRTKQLLRKEEHEVDAQCALNVHTHAYMYCKNECKNEESITEIVRISICNLRSSIHRYIYEGDVFI